MSLTPDPRKPATSLGEPWPAPIIIPKYTLTSISADFKSKLAILIGKTTKSVGEADTPGLRPGLHGVQRHLNAGGPVRAVAVAALQGLLHRVPARPRACVVQDGAVQDGAGRGKAEDARAVDWEGHGGERAGVSLAVRRGTESVLTDIHRQRSDLQRAEASELLLSGHDAAAGSGHCYRNTSGNKGQQGTRRSICMVRISLS